jgi:hypothetical protein
MSQGAIISIVAIPGHLEQICKNTKIIFYLGNYSSTKVPLYLENLLFILLTTIDMHEILRQNTDMAAKQQV